MLALANYANNDDDTCWPSVQRLADMTQVSMRQVQRILRKLTDDGYIEQLSKGHGRGNTAQYRIVLKGDICDLKGDTIASPFDQPEKVTSEAIKGDISREKVTSGALKGDIAMSPDPYRSVFRSVEPERDHAREAPPTSSPDDRSVIKSPYLPTGKLLAKGYWPPGSGENAVQVYYERFSLSDPRARLYPPQEDDLMRICSDLDRLRDVVTAYSRTNYQPGNIQLILDWYRNGVPDRNQTQSTNRSNQNGSYRRRAEGIDLPKQPERAPAFDQFTPEQIEQIRALKRVQPRVAHNSGPIAPA